MLKIRRFKKDDYDEVVSILKEAELFDEVWEDKENIFGMVREDPNSVLVASIEGKVVGCVFVIHYGPKLNYLFRLAVRKNNRKKGVGTALLGKAVELAKKKGVKEVGMYVESTNKELLEYYKKRNFKRSKSSYFYMWREKI